MDRHVEELIAVTGALLACILEFTRVSLLSARLRPFADYLLSFFPQAFPPGWMDPAAIYGFIIDLTLFLIVFTVYFAIIFVATVAIRKVADRR